MGRSSLDGSHTWPMILAVQVQRIFYAELLRVDRIRAFLRPRDSHDSPRQSVSSGYVYPSSSTASSLTNLCRRRTTRQPAVDLDPNDILIWELDSGVKVPCNAVVLCSSLHRECKCECLEQM